MPDTTFTISNVEHVAPAKPTGFSATVSSTSTVPVYDTTNTVLNNITVTNISFSWTANSESNISVYKVIRSDTGQVVYKGTAHSGKYSTTELAGNSIGFFVIATDTWDKTSPASTVSTVTL